MTLILDALLAGSRTIRSDGVDMPLRKAINFLGCTLTDDSVNDATKVDPGGAVTFTRVKAALAAADSAVGFNARAIERVTAVRAPLAGSLVLGIDAADSLTISDDATTFPFAVVRVQPATHVGVQPTTSPAATAGRSVIVRAGMAGPTGAKSVGGDLYLLGGDADGTTGAGVKGGSVSVTAGGGQAGTGTTGDGGDVEVKGGPKDGTAQDGRVYLKGDDGTTRVTVDRTGLAFFGNAPIAQQTRAGQLTGAFGTTGTAIVDAGAAYSQSNVNDNFRRLEDAFNRLETIVHNLGLST